MSAVRFWRRLAIGWVVLLAAVFWEIHVLWTARTYGWRSALRLENASAAETAAAVVFLLVILVLQLRLAFGIVRYWRRSGLAS
jgi:hypothetical protein